MPTSRLELDLAAVERNLQTLRRTVNPHTSHGAGADIAGQLKARGHVPGPHQEENTRHEHQAVAPRHDARGTVNICAVVKQDGYGTGGVRLAKRLAASGVEMLAVYSLDEARQIADAVAKTPILVLMPVRQIDRHDPLYRHAAMGRIHLVVHDQGQLSSLSEMASRLGVNLPVHVQLDSGLARGGVCPADARQLVQQAAASMRVRIAGLMTHFASPCCDEQFTREQSRVFREFIESVKPMLREAVAAGRAEGGMAVHAANSCATFRSSRYHGTMVRVGQGLLGYCSEEFAEHDADKFEFAEAARALTPAVRWTSSIAHVQSVPAGWPVGYGSTWRAPRHSKVALVPVGYADGYARALGGGYGVGWVGLTARKWERPGGAEIDELGAGNRTTGETPGNGSVIYAPVVGRVSMDQITVDVTDVPEQFAAVGAEVELFGRDKGGRNYLPTLAAAAGTITHELLCRIGPRVERVYRYPAEADLPPTATASDTLGLRRDVHLAAG